MRIGCAIAAIMFTQKLNADDAPAQAEAYRAAGGMRHRRPFSGIATGKRAARGHARHPAAPGEFDGRLYQQE